MLQKKQFCFIGIILISLALFGFHSQVYAEQVNESVKDCLEQPDSCGEKQEKAQTENAVKDTVTNDSMKVGLTAWDFVKMILATIFVVALLYFVLKFVNKKGNLFKSSQIVENLGGATLGSNRSVQVIKVGNRLLVLGVGENIQLLTEIADGQEYEKILLNYNSKLDQLAQPSDIVARVIKKVKGSKKSESAGNNGGSGHHSHFQALLQSQLDDLSKGRKKIYEEMEKKKDTDKQ